MHPYCNQFCAARSTTSSGRISVEAIVGVLIASFAMLIFGLMMIAGGEREKSSEPTATNSPARSAHPHEAVALAAPSSNGESTNTVVRDGITVLTPPLLVPVVNLNEQGQADSDVDSDDDTDADANGGTSSTTPIRQHRHRSSLHARARTNTERTIVGLAADRRTVTKDR